MALTDTAVRHAKPRAKDYTLSGCNGLAHILGVVSDELSRQVDPSRRTERASPYCMQIVIDDF
ncbi:hypothetical protein SAMN03159512_05151 [Pseudomonas sp. NFR09]|jgi:hypothetical protein|nr:hypothetical protein SAMN03159512_05151 [Pseudomonas sp. NFR09]